MAQNFCRNSIAHKPRYNNRYIEFFKALSPPHILGSTLASRLRVKISSSNLQSRKNSDIELQACDGNLFAWIMVYKLINSPSTYPSDRISACSCSFGSMGLTVEATAVFFSFEEFFSARHFARKSEKFWPVIELQSRTQLFSGATPVISGDSAV